MNISTKIYRIWLSGISALGIVMMLMGCSEQQPGSSDQYSSVPPDTVYPTGETGRYNVHGWPIMALPPGIDPEEDPRWQGVDTVPKPPVLPVSPDQQVNRIIPQRGYNIEPVLTDPIVDSPAQIAFDGNGRMFVLELVTYMLDSDATDERTPRSRISVHEDTNNDGIYDHHTVFVDNLVFPRFVLPYGENTILMMETDSDNVYKYTDSNGDGTADTRELFATDFGNPGNVEHQQAGLHWGMDNWLYSNSNSFRVRETPDGVVLRESTGSNSSSWGVTHDNDGKVWFQGGASGVPGQFQFPVHYGNFEVDDEYAEGFRTAWGAPVKVADMQGSQQGAPGWDQIRFPDGSLSEVTGSSGSVVFRGHRLPEELVGQYFYGEPVGRFVRQVNPVITEGLTQLHNVYQDIQKEFLSSTDPLFRPVELATAPDGTMYIVDMYHGIIQQAQWNQPGTYLRFKVQQYQLDKVVGLGRIFRLTHESMPRDTTRPRMFEETAAELVEHLSHSNGWWRDTAQRLLVLRQDQSVVPDLERIVRNSDNLLERFHALWTLEGLGSLEVSLVREMFDDPEPRMRIQALRASETLYKNGEFSLEEDYAALAGTEEDTDALIQVMLSVSVLDAISDKNALYRQAMASSNARGVQLVGQQLLDRPDYFAGEFRGVSELEREVLEEGRTIFQNNCSQCHGASGRGTPAGAGQTLAPTMIGSENIQLHRDYVINVLLHGMSGSINGRSYAGGAMTPMGENPDEWIAAISSFIRTQFENGASMVTSGQVAEVRQATSGRSSMYTYEELMSEIPQELEFNPDWQISASHTGVARIGGLGIPAAAFNFEGWTTGKPQEPGMWFQVELPQAEMLTDIEFDAPRFRSERGQPSFMTSPREYRVEVSTDGNNWTPVTTGSSESRYVSIYFRPVEARFIRIVQTGSSENAPWSIQQLKLYAAQNKPVN